MRKDENTLHATRKQRIWHHENLAPWSCNNREDVRTAIDVAFDLGWWDKKRITLRDLDDLGIPEGPAAAIKATILDLRKRDRGTGRTAAEARIDRILYVTDSKGRRSRRRWS